MQKTSYTELLFNLFISIITVCPLLLLVPGCSTSKKTQAEKDFIARTVEIQKLKDTRAAFPCDTIRTQVTHIDTAYIFTDADTVRIGDTIRITRFQQLIKTVNIEHAVIDKAEVQAARDSIMNANFIASQYLDSYNQSQKAVAELTARVKQLKPWKDWAVGAIMSMSVIGLGLLVFKLKKFFI